MLHLRKIVDSFRQCLRDEKAQALTEYVILMLVVSTICFWLYYPHNYLFTSAKRSSDLTALLISMPGP